jgi:hypothetical protein
MTGNRVPGTPVQTGENQDKPLAMPSKPPPPPVRSKSGAPPPFPQTSVRTANPPPAPARAVLSQPPPPPKRSKSPPPSPSVAPVRAFPGPGASKPPPPPSSRKQPSVPPPLPVQAVPAAIAPAAIAPAAIAPASIAAPPAMPAVVGLPPWAAPQPAIVESEILPVEPQVTAAPSARVVDAAPIAVAASPLIVEPPAIVEPSAIVEPPAIAEVAAAPSVAEVAASVEGAAEPTIEEASLSAEAPAKPEVQATAEAPSAPEEAPAALEAAPSPDDEPTHDEPTHDAPTPESPTTEAMASEELDSNSDNEPTHVLDGAIPRARLAQSQLAEDEPSHEEQGHEEQSHEESASAESSTIMSEEAALDAEAAPAEAEHETRPLAVEQALALEHALDGERAPDPFEASEPAKAARDFSSIGSEMPVVLSAPAPRRAEGATAALLEAGRTWLPEAQAWSKKTLRATPRTLVISAPFVALFGIWAAHSIAKRSHHDAPTASAAADIAPANATPEAASHASAVLAPPPIPAAVAAVEPASPPAANVDPAELKSAQSHGLPALEALSAKYPGDVQVGLALASEQAKAQRFEAAVSTVDQLLTASPSSAQNGKAMGILWRAAQSPASEQTFLSLRKLGGRGSDVAFDLAVTPGVRDSVRERARAELAEHLAGGASADTRVAAALLLAPDCSARKSLLERAEHEGGKRTRGLLERYSRGTACSSSDSACNACLAGSAELTQAIATLSEGARP